MCCHWGSEAEHEEAEDASGEPGDDGEGEGEGGECVESEDEMDDDPIVDPSTSEVLQLYIHVCWLISRIYALTTQSMCGWVVSQVAPSGDGRDKDIPPKNDDVPKGFISAIKAWLSNSSLQ